MLEIIGLIAIGKWFHKTAKNNELNAVLWTFIGVGSYFLGAIVAGVIIGFTAPELLDQTLVLSLFAIIAGVIGAGVAYYFFQSVIKNKNSKKENSNDLVIDDNTTFLEQKESDF